MNQPNRVAVARESTTKWRVSPYLRIIFSALLLATSGIFLSGDVRPQSQNSPAQPQGTAKPAKKKYRLRITKGEIIGVSVKADKAKMTDIAAELSRRLGTQVILGPEMRKEAITVEFYDLPLEPALRLLAPHVYIDYEIKANTQPTLLGIFLMGYGDPDPAKTAVVQGSSQALMIEGNTEDPTDQEVKPEDDPLQVDLDGNRLTIKSKKQPIAAVVMTIAEVLEVPAEIKYDSNEIVDTEIKDTPFEDAIPRLSPNIRLYVRADLTRSQRTPLRLALLPPTKVPETATQ